MPVKMSVKRNTQVDMVFQSPAIEINMVDALWVLIQGQTKAVRKALARRLQEEDSVAKVQQAKVKKSLTKAFEELHACQVKHDARNLFSEK